MPSILDRKIITTLTNEQFKLFKSLGLVIDNEYFHLPQYFKCLGAGEFEIINFEDLPEDVQELAESEEVKSLKKEIDLSDELYEDIKKVLQAIPECPIHGNMCIPNAMQWIEKKKKL